jgi:hypothetical protein
MSAAIISTDNPSNETFVYTVALEEYYDVTISLNIYAMNFTGP